jgi:EF hand
MNTKLKFAAAAAMLCCAAANAGDQQRAAAPGKGTGSGILPEFSTLDTNGDGVISREEARTQAGLAAIFVDVDSNHNGQLDSQEYAEARNRLEE